MIKTSIIWFKTDLRLFDNETISIAIAESAQVIPIYFFNDAHYKTSEFGFKKTGNFRTPFLLESLVDLNRELEKLGSGLLVLQGAPEIEISKIVRKYNVSAIYTEEEVGIEELRTQILVEDELKKFNCVVNITHTHNLYQPQNLPFEIENIPNVFTDFRKKVESNSNVEDIFDRPIKVSTPKNLLFNLPSLASLGLENVNKDARSVIDFKGGSFAAHERLQQYFFQDKHLSTYKETRNGMIGADYSSKFSAWLALGCISPREIYHQIKKYENQFGANDSTYWLVFELLWRDYFWLMMKKYGAKFFQLNGIRKKLIPIPEDQDQAKINKWVNGETGNRFIDANMQELSLLDF
ncbi:DASH family cryptochrome [Pedobacter mucosus]|nr:DASH family cryptochrome [Pedobacter mucosus]UKT64532.1 DASH family cryptochrome [Pedobacter mucosus]